MESAPPTCRHQWSQRQRCMFGVASRLRSVPQLTVHSRSSNVSAHPASNCTSGPTPMVLLVRRFNIGRTALQLSSPKIRKWQVVRHSAENLNNQQVNNQSKQIKPLKTLVLPRNYPGHSPGAEQSYTYEHSTHKLVFLFYVYIFIVFTMFHKDVIHGDVWKFRASPLTHTSYE